VEQLDAQRVFHAADRLGQGGGRRAQLARGPREAAVLGRLGEGGHLLHRLLHGVGSIADIMSPM
jgi:hypothetical protein